MGDATMELFAVGTCLLHFFLFVVALSASLLCRRSWSSLPLFLLLVIPAELRSHRGFIAGYGSVRRFVALGFVGVIVCHFFGGSG